MPVKVYRDIDTLPEAWSELLETAGEENYFFGSDWFANFTAAALDAATEPRFYGVEADDGRPMMIAALQSPSSLEGTILRYNFQRQGSLSAMANFHSCEFGVAKAEDADLGDTLQELANYLRGERPAWSLVEIHSLDRESPLFSGLVHAFRQAGYLVGTRFHFGNWYDRFDCPNYAEYLKSRDAGTRKAFKNYARLGRKFAKTGKTEFRLFADDGDIEKGVADFRRIHSESWKGTESYWDLLSGVLRSTAQAGRLRMGILYRDDVAVAVEIGVLSGRRATMIQTAYDDRFREYSVGSLVTIKVFEHLVAVDKVREIDFGRDDQPYKKLWLPKRRERWGVVAFNPGHFRSIRPMLSFYRDTGVDRFAQRIKPWVNPMLHRFRK